MLNFEQRYKLMAKEFDNLSDDERRFLLWLAGSDVWTMDQLMSIVKKVKS